MKLCKDCKHCANNWFFTLIGFYEGAMCNKIKSGVDGGPRYRCQTQRDHECGEIGLHFEAKE